MRRLSGLGVILSTGLIAACGSSSSPPPVFDGGAGGPGGGGKAGATAGTTGQGGAGGQPLGGAGGQPVGGAGGHASAGSGGQPAGGTGGQPCLDPVTFASAFSIADATFCAVALYTAPESIGYQAPTWGSHGGPLVVQKTATATNLTLERWTAPTGSTGTMTLAQVPIAGGLPALTFLGAQALDLPFFGWTAISWTNAYPDSTGQFEMYTADSIAAQYTVNGPYGVAAVPSAGSLGRLLYTGLSPLGMATASVPGLYAADACSAPAPALGVGTGCSDSALVAAWGDSAGPVVTDSDGDAFVVMNSFANGTQEARGFLASSIARGAAATAGVSLFTMAGSSVALAALAPAASDPGLVIFQPADSSDKPLDVVEQKFTTSGSLVAIGTPTTMLTVAPGQGLSFLVDGTDRLWVAASGTASTMYVVLARRP